MGNMKKWLDNARSISLPQSLMPAVLAAVLSAGQGRYSFILSLLAVLGVGCLHLAFNLADDWFDYKVDMKGDRDKVTRQGFRAMTVKYPYLTDGSETLESTAKAIACFLGFALACGVVIFCFRLSWVIPALAAAAAFLGIFYSAPPFKLAYHGLGELVIGLMFGPLSMMGVYYSSCGQIDWTIVFISIPVGLLVLNILYVHSIIDMPADTASNKMTFARLIGRPALNVALFILFNAAAFILVAVGVAMGFMHPAYLAVLLCAPMSVWLCSSVWKFSRGQVEVPDKPAWFLGPMPDWAKYKAAGIDWFLMRWLCARNIVSFYSLILIIVKIALLILG